MSKAIEVKVSQRQKTILNKWVRNKSDTTYRMVQRCQIILSAAMGESTAEQGRRLDIDRQRLQRWQRRWVASQEHLANAEAQGATDQDLANLITKVLSDRERLGAPSKFSAEQLTKIIAVACEPPQESGRPVTRWTPPELANEVIKRGIVESISPRHIDRLLKGGISVHTRVSTG